MKEYHYTKEHILYELPMLDGFALESYAKLNDPINRFGGIEMVTSYASQEADILYDELKEIMKNKQNETNT